MSLYRAVTDRRYRRNRFLRFYRHLVRTGSAFPRLPRRFAPRNDKSDSFAPPNYCCKTCDCQWRSLTAATDAIGAYHFNDGLYQSRVPRREGHAPPLQWRVQSPRVPGNLQLPMAVTPRKGHAASVRRQSRQRLRSDRRYRRNRLVCFYRHLVRTGSAFPRLPRRFAPRNDNSEVHTILTMACTDRQHCAGSGMPLPYSGAHHLTTAGTNWKCLPEIATSACGLLAMTNLWLSPFYR